MDSISDTVDQIQQKATEFDLGRALLTLLALPFFVLGWAARHVVLALAWVWAAVLVGWRVAVEPRRTAGGS